MKKSLGTLLKTARESKGLTLKQAAAKCGISHFYMSHLERNSPVRLSDKLTLKLSKVLGLKLKSIQAFQGPHNKRASIVTARYRRNEAKKLAQKKALAQPRIEAIPTPEAQAQEPYAALIMQMLAAPELLQAAKDALGALVSIREKRLSYMSTEAVLKRAIARATGQVEKD